MMTAMQAITATVAITLGVTVYEAEPGKALACHGHPYDTAEEWVAVPTEWVLSGFVECGDLVYGCLPNGHCLEGVPIMDTGCLLHYPVWPVGDGVPFGLDIPIHMRELYGSFNTGRMTFQVYRLSQQSFWTPTPWHLWAWDTKHCHGPLTIEPGDWPGKYKPY